MGQGPPNNYYDHTPGAAVENNSRWMSRLRDDTHITLLSIPGTHSSCSLWGGPMYQCQSWSLDTQFRAGIRFIDIRCSHVDGNNSLVVYYGIRNQYMTLDSVFRNTLGFLRNNPREFVFIRLVEVGNYDRVTNKFKDAVDAAVNAWEGKNFWRAHAACDVGQVRGKIILIEDHNSLNQPTLQLKSIYKYMENRIFQRINREQMWLTIENRIQRAGIATEQISPDQRHLFITFCTGFSMWDYPDSVAHEMNRRLYDFVREMNQRSTGVLVLDFPASPLIREIIALNDVYRR